MTISGTIRQNAIDHVGTEAPTFTFAIRDESNKMADYLWLWTRSVWLAALAERYMVYTGRPTVTVIYDDATKELTGIGMPTVEETPCS